MDRNSHLGKTPTPSTTTSDLFTVLGRWAWGWCTALDIQGSCAYVANGETFQVYNVFDPTTPVLVGEVIIDGWITDIKVKDNHAFVCCWSGLKIIDVASPSMPILISSTPEEYGGATRIELLDTVALVCYSGGISTVDIKDLYHPRILDYFPTLAEFMSIKGSYAYAAYSESSSILILDISKTDSLKAVNFIDIYPDFWIEDIKVISNYLYVATKSGTLQIYELADPQNPIRVNRFLYSIWYRISCDSNYIYMSVSDSAKILIFDYNNPSIPRIVGSVDAWGMMMVPAQGFLYIAAGDAFEVADVRDTNSTRILCRYPFAGGPHNAFIQHTNAYVATDGNGVWVLDISNPLAARPIANINIGRGSADVLVDGNYAYIVNYNDAEFRGLWIADISDPSHPQIVSYHIGIVIPGRFTPAEVSIAKWGDYLFITQPGSAQNDSTLEIIDVSNPSLPSTLSVFTCPYEPWDLAVKDSIIYLATNYGGLRLINYSNPSDPVEVLTMLNHTYRLTRAGNYLYVAATDSIYILNIAQPAAPILLGSTPSAGGHYADLAASENFLYCTYFGSLEVFNISNPHAIVKSGTFISDKWMDHNWSGVFADKNMILLSDPISGVWFLQNKYEMSQLSQYEVTTGWNLLSAPTGSMEKKRYIGDVILAPDARSPAYTYSGSGYSAPDTINDGIGFWMKFNSVQSVRFYGSPLQSTVVNLHKGWNIIGSVGNPLPTSLITTDPVGIITSNYFQYQGQYNVSDTIYPAQGYWVKASEAGALTLSLNQSFDAQKEKHSNYDQAQAILGSLDRLELRDPEGHHQSLYFGSNLDKVTISKFELPPPVPSGDFDTRFYSGNMAEMIQQGDSTKHVILLHSAKYPVTLTWHIVSSGVQYILNINGKETALSTDGSRQVLIPGSVITLVSIRLQALPNEFTLEQNYPNPFNGRTIIRYGVPQLTALPSEMHNVSIKVYTILGQEVAVLVNEDKPPGEYSVFWDPVKYPSGIYFYRLEVEKTTLTKPMMYIK